VNLAITFSGLAKVAIFTTNVDAENQTLINHKCVCGALNRHFCQTRVIGWRSCLLWVTTIFMSSVCVICRVLFCLACVLGVLFFLKRWKFFKNNFSFGSALQALLKTMDVRRLVRFLIVLANITWLA
jgi:hypothetical protein